MSKTRYPQAQSGEWIRPKRENFRVECCDCGLIHIVNFRIIGGKIQFRAIRDNRATGKNRRAHNIRIK